ncbi:hypothetical protein GCM10020367_63420 [Streptomyces sannanensis]|uniref:Uncharacterized protein n=1 Tax=Streptomyces sannanensis TaxID=285536 RepID=A0ABP6SKX2_9ACTN
MSRTPHGKTSRNDPATEAFLAGLAVVRRNPALAALEADVCRSRECDRNPRHGLAAVEGIRDHGRGRRHQEHHGLPDREAGAERRLQCASDTSLNVRVTESCPTPDETG